MHHCPGAKELSNFKRVHDIGQFEGEMYIAVNMNISFSTDNCIIIGFTNKQKKAIILFRLTKVIRKVSLYELTFK